MMCEACNQNKAKVIRDILVNIEMQDILLCETCDQSYQTETAA